MVLKGYLFSLLYAFLCLGIGLGLYKIKVDKKITRKLVHILVGAEWLILYHFVGVSIHFLIVCLFFLLVLWISHRKNLMPMISSDGDNAPGTVYYALAMTVMAGICLVLPDMMLFFGIGVFCTSLGDGLAGIVGYGFNPDRTPNIRIFGNKSLFGTLITFIACFGVTYAFDAYFSLGLKAWHIVAIALFATELELVTGRGLDNITVTLGSSFLAYSFFAFSSVENYIVPILLTPAIIAFAKKKKALTTGGIIAALAVDIAISITLRSFGFCILLAFFAGGIIVDKIKKKTQKTKQNVENVEKRGSCRDHIQVLANALVATVCAALYFFFDSRVFLIAFVASLAEALADTAASGVGALSGQAYDIFRRRPCQVGLSGGMSLLGTLASVVAALLVGVLALAFGEINLTEMSIITLAAVLGAFFDSLLGSLAQVKYKCSVCGSVVEREQHCGEPAVRYSGIPFVNNDLVNLASTLFAAGISAVIYLAS